MPTADYCPDHDTLSQLLLGNLSPEAAERLAEHLEHCDHCALAADSLRIDSDLTNAARGSAATDQWLDDEQVSSLIEQALVSLDLRHGGLDGDCTRLLGPPRQEDEIGRLGSYRILRVLGRGGMGIVFLAEDVQLRRRVALKLIRPSLSPSPFARQRFLAEAQAAAAIEDERIVAIHQVGEDRGVPYIVMQLLQGSSLLERLRAESAGGRRRPLAVSEVLQIGREIALGLASAHTRGLIHRDIKPANIWLEGYDRSVPWNAAGSASRMRRVKLLDFGLARQFDSGASLTRSGVLAGTPAYLAPEQVRGEPIDARCDLFSLGCVLYELATGCSPFARPSAAAALYAIVSHTPAAPHELNAQVPEPLSKLIVRLLAKDPAQRPASARDVAGQLSEIGSGAWRSETLQPLPCEQPARAHGAPKRRRTKIAVAVGTAVLLVGLSAAALLSMRPDRRAPRKERPSWSVFVPAQEEDRQKPEIDSWSQALAGLAPPQQLVRVADELRQRNPEFDGQLTPKIWNDAVVELEIVTDRVSDISPLTSLRRLRKLTCRGSGPNQGQLADLSPLEHLEALAVLDCADNQIADLLPLAELPLRELNCSGNPVASLDPLRNMPLEGLELQRTFVTDLAPLRSVPLQQLDIRATFIRDLWPLEEMTTLRELRCYFRPHRDATVLRPHPGLRNLNGKTTEQFWSDFDARNQSLKEWLPRAVALPERDKPAAVAAKLQELNPGFSGKVHFNFVDGKLTVFQLFTDEVTDIEPLRALNHLERLTVRGTERGRGKLYDLEPLKDLPLFYLECGFNELGDLSPLEGTGLQVLQCRGTRVRDLAPLRNMPVFYLECSLTPVADLRPLVGRPITILHLRDTLVRDYSPLRQFPVHVLGADLDPRRDKALLQSILTLETLNDRPVVELWE